MIESSQRPWIVIDGRNSARSKNGKPNWNHTLVIATHFAERQFPVFVVMPHWAGKDQQENIHKIAKIQFVDIADDKEYDDKIALGLCFVGNGYYLSNDKNMHKHLDGNLVSRNWCTSRRIGFHFDEGENFIPHYPDIWEYENDYSDDIKISTKMVTMEVKI